MRTKTVGDLTRKPIKDNKKLPINRSDYIRVIIRDAHEEMRHMLGCTSVCNAFFIETFHYLLSIFFNINV